MAAPTPIFCGGGNARFCEIALAAGFRYGSQLPGTPYAPIYFADQNWKKPNRALYMAALALHRPQMATVLDWEREEQFSEVLDWAEESAQFAESVVIIPKVVNEVHRIPNCIGGKPVIIGYSIPTQFGGTCVPIWELEGRRVHLLGGSPHRQMREYEAMRAFCEVVSADGNMAMKMATGRCCYWRQESFGRQGHWPHLLEGITNDAPYEAFRRSCTNIVEAWKRI